MKNCNSGVVSYPQVEIDDTPFAACACHMCKRCRKAPERDLKEKGVRDASSGVESASPVYHQEDGPFEAPPGLP